MTTKQNNSHQRKFLQMTQNKSKTPRTTQKNKEKNQVNLGFITPFRLTPVHCSK